MDQDKDQAVAQPVADEQAQTAEQANDNGNTIPESEQLPGDDAEEDEDGEDGA